MRTFMEPPKCCHLRLTNSSGLGSLPTLVNAIPAWRDRDTISQLHEYPLPSFLPLPQLPRIHNTTLNTSIFVGTHRLKLHPQKPTVMHPLRSSHLRFLGVEEMVEWSKLFPPADSLAQPLWLSCSRSHGHPAPHCSPTIPQLFLLTHTLPLHIITGSRT